MTNETDNKNIPPVLEGEGSPVPTPAIPVITAEQITVDPLSVDLHSISSANPIVLKRIYKNKDTGGVEVLLPLSADQTYLLLQFALMFLVGQGLITFSDPPKDPEIVEPVTPGPQLH